MKLVLELFNAKQHRAKLARCAIALEKSYRNSKSKSLRKETSARIKKVEKKLRICDFKVQYFTRLYTNHVERQIKEINKF